MSAKKSAAIALVLFCSAFGIVSVAAAANPVTTADELVAQHLDSIASAKVRGEFKTRIAQGPITFKILVGGAGTLDGKAQMASDGKKLVFVMKLTNNEYRGEQFIFDGDKDQVAFSSAQKTRSAFGNFVFVQDAVIREGLLGGTISTAWPLLNLEARKPKLTFDGLKKIDGQELYDLRYQPKKSSDLDVHLYFDPQTLRHVETLYSYSISNRLSTGGETAAAQQQQTRYRLQEKFSDFKSVDGVTLPTHYNIQFTAELGNGRTTLSDWDMKALDILNNQSVDARNFEVK
jgi:hypothetical protein